VKRTLPAIIATTATVIVVLTTFFGVAPEVGQELDKWYVLSTAVVCCSGLVNLTNVHVRNITKGAKDWDLSVLLIVLTYGLLVLGVVTSPTNDIYAWIFESTVVPLGATFYSILAFYIVSAAYRAFRARSLDATVLLGAAILVLLGRAPLGEALYPGFGNATKWIMDIPNTAAMRAIGFGATLGSLITAVRVFLGFERAYASTGE
jgi:hypothetical protein